MIEFITNPAVISQSLHKIQRTPVRSKVSLELIAFGYDFLTFFGNADPDDADVPSLRPTLPYVLDTKDLL